MPDREQERRVLFPVHRGDRPGQAVDGSGSEAQRVDQRSRQASRAAERSRGRRLRPRRRAARRPQGAGERSAVWGRPTSSTTSASGTRTLLNPQGVNCIRNINGNITVYGGRTVGGDRNGEWKYVNVRRVMLFLKESIDEGTQWVVFEPNDPSLWAKIRLNVGAFLTRVWESGALFGLTPQEAFYVKCDEETNPPEVRDVGQVVVEVGVAIVRPAEFVIFRVTQWAGPAKS